MAVTDAAHLLPGYAAAGVAVLPLHRVIDGRCSCGRQCPTPGKHPRTPNGAKNATTDVGQIAEWMARWPDANWGGVPPKDVVVLDVDPRNGGDVTMAALEARHGDLPATLTAQTGSGGWHIWFSYKGPVKGKFAQGVDIKTSTGYLVLPPSIHPCGDPYRWANTSPAVPAPRWVRLMVAPTPPRVLDHPLRTSGDIAPLVRFVAEAPEGDRNSRLYWSACRAHEAGADPAPLVEAAEQAGLTRFEAEATVRSAENAPARGGGR